MTLKKDAMGEFLKSFARRVHAIFFLLFSKLAFITGISSVLPRERKKIPKQNGRYVTVSTTENFKRGGGPFR